MFLIFALLLLSLWVWLFLNVYASFFPFLQSIGHISDYNVAYYSAISAVERGMLVTKYRAPGFVGSGWILAWTGRGPAVDQTVFFVTGSTQGNWRTVNSRTTMIPGSGEGNVDPFLSTGDSSNYNALRYGVSERFLLSVDDTTAPEEYYSGGVHSHLTAVHVWTFSGEMRLPPFVYSNFDVGGDPLLCGNIRCDNNGITDEVKVVRWMVGTYLSTATFSIIPTIGVFYYSGMQINNPYDNALRVSLLAPSATLKPNGNWYTFVGHGDSLSGHTVVSSMASTIAPFNFPTILGGTDFTDIELSFGLVSLLRSLQWAVYPYLEYRFDFGTHAIADRFYTIDGHGRNRDYDVQIQVKKPTVQGTVGGDFTVIF